MWRAALPMMGVAVLLLASTAQAAALEEPAPDTGSGKGWRSPGDLYLKGYTGVGLTEDSDLDVTQSDALFGDSDLTFHGVNWDDNSIGGPSAPYFGVRFGYFLKSRPWMGFALDFLHFKIFAREGRDYRVTGIDQGTPIDTVQPMNVIASRYQATNGVTLIPVSFIARLRKMRSEQFPDGLLQPYAGVGAGLTVSYTVSTVNGRNDEGEYEFGDLSTHLFAGLQVKLNRRWDIFVEYRRTSTEVDGSISGGDSRTDVDTDHYIAGAGFHF